MQFRRFLPVFALPRRRSRDRSRFLLHRLAALLLCALPGAAQATPVETGGYAHAAPGARLHLAGLSVPFLARADGDDPRVAFAARTSEGAVFVTRDGQLVHSLRGAPPTPRAAASARGAASRPHSRGWSLTESLVGAHAEPRGAAASATRISRFVGNDPAHWEPAAQAFDRVTLGEAWPGIVVDVTARAGAVEKLFTVAPHADARRIAVRVRGAQRLARSADGALVAHTGLGPVTLTAPSAWQDIDGARRPVPVAYTLAGDRYGFALGDYDRAHPVVIDPLLQSTYLGGSGGDVAWATAVDANGDVFVAGSTGSFNFPGTAGGAQAAAAANGDAFVARLNRNLTTLVQATYLGGGGGDVAQALAIDSTGAVLVAGSTTSVNFPGTAGGAQASPGGGGDAFVARLSHDLAQLLQSTYVGGSALDQGFALAVQPGGSVYVAGGTSSVNFPATAGGAQPVRAGAGDAFVAKLDATLTQLARATYLGGSGSDTAYALARDGTGAIFVAGNTGSTNFPGTGGSAQPVAGGGGDAFVAQLAGDLVTLVKATFLGGAGADFAYALALDAGGAVLVAGETASTNFPGTAGGAQPVRGGASDAFVARLDRTLATLMRATYAGGLSDDVANALAVDGTGAVFIAGNTLSTQFPGTAGGAQAGPGGNGDAFAARFDATLAKLVQSTYLGGSGLDQAFALAVDARGKAYVAGGTSSTNMPKSAGGAQSAPGGNGDAFAAMLTSSLRLVDSPAIEYRHAEWDHYFVTASTDEIAKLDAGVFAGWARTGESFKVLPLDTAGKANVCRFFSVSFAPKSSHFYTPSARECATVKENPDWEFEAEVFAVGLPDTGGNCAGGTLPLYRLYNDGQGGAPNHRYTTSAATRSDMLAQGWISEGTGDLGVIACVPA